MDDREQYLLNEVARLRKENAELREQIERYENEGGSHYDKKASEQTQRNLWLE